MSQDTESPWGQGTEHFEDFGKVSDKKPDFVVGVSRDEGEPTNTVIGTTKETNEFFKAQGLQLDSIRKSNNRLLLVAAIKASGWLGGGLGTAEQFLREADELARQGHQGAPIAWETAAVGAAVFGAAKAGEKVVDYMQNRRLKTVTHE